MTTPCPLARHTAIALILCLAAACDAAGDDAGGYATSPVAGGVLPCGQVFSGCACVPGYGSTWFPGQRVSASGCASGVAELTTCGGECGGFVPSAAICACDGIGPEAGDPDGAACAALPPRVWQGQAPCLAINTYERGLLDRLATVWHTAPLTVCSYDSRAQPVSGPCGALTWGAFYCGIDDAIAWDAGFMNDQAARHGDFASVAIIAHEWGHLHEHRLGLLTRLDSKTKELMADCHAGVFAAVEARAGLLDEGDACEAFRSLCEAGDPVGGWFNPQAHGTCDERVAAFEHGFEGAPAHYGRLCGPDPVGAMAAICAWPR